MYHFYVLYSLKDGRLYKGSTSNLLERIQQHNAGRNRSTKNRRPFILLYFEGFHSNQGSMKRERWSKTLEGGSELKRNLIKEGLLNASGHLNTV